MLTPLADAVEATLPPPYRAAAVRAEADVWSVAAESVTIVEVPLEKGDVIDLSSVDGVRELSIDRARTIRPRAPLEALAEQHGGVSPHAERVDGNVLAVDVVPL